MIPTLWDILFSTGEDPVTFKERLIAGFKHAGYFIGFGLLLMFTVVIVALVGILLLDTMRFWPPFLSLLAILGFLRGYGIWRTGEKRRE